jgi:hypothetical protein
MTRSRRLQERGRRRLALLSISLLIALGCSSGGSGSSGKSTAPAEITLANALIISATAVDAAMGGSGLAGVGGSIPFLPAPVSGGGGASAPLSLEPLPLEFIGLFADLGSGDERQLAGQPEPGVVLQVAIPPILIDCAENGSVTISGEMANPPELTVGDRFSGEFSDCDDGLGVVLNGGLDFTMVSFSQSIADCFENQEQCVAENQLTIDTVLRNLEVTEGEITFTGKGDMRIAIDTLTPPTSVARLSGSSLTASDGTHSETLRDYDTLTTTNLTSGDYEVVASGRLTSSRFSGEIQYATTPSFLGTGTSDPDSGVLRIDGADAATIDVVAQANGVDVNLEIDVDGDGNVDDIKMTTWDDLRALL